jgi:hypothetical protein
MLDAVHLEYLDERLFCGHAHGWIFLVNAGAFRQMDRLLARAPRRSLEPEARDTGVHRPETLHKALNRKVQRLDIALPFALA